MKSPVPDIKLNKLLCDAGVTCANPQALIPLAETMLKQGDLQAALDIANFAVLLAPQDFQVLRGASGVIAQSRNYQRCAELMQRALSLAPDHADSQLHYAIILIELREYAAARQHLHALLTLQPDSAPGWRNLSSIFAHEGDYAAAAEACERAITLAPETREYVLHYVGLLLVLERIPESYRLLQQLEKQQPNDPVVARLLSAAAAIAGDNDAALQHAERAYTLAPNNLEYGQHLEHLQKVRGTLDLPTVQRRLHPVFPPSIKPRYRRRAAAGNMMRVIVSVLIREASTRFGGTRLGYVWAILEPVSHLALLAVVFSFLNTGNHPPIGDSMLVYYFSGVLPYLLFTNTIMHVQVGIEANRSLLQIPIVKPLDVLLARGLLELLTQTIVAVLMLTAFGIFGLNSIPHNIAQCFGALLAVWMLGMGFGIFNSVMHHFIKSWEHIFASVTRALYFISGIFLSPIMMPPPVRDILVWNPLLQGIDMFRKGFYEFYEPHWLNIGYLFAVALMMLTLGLAMERSTRRRLSSII